MSRLATLFAIVFVTSACGVLPEKVSRSDHRVKQLLKARDRIDTTAYGFTKIGDDATLRLEGKRDAYDAMLHVDEPISRRTIAFRKNADLYEWVGEQEIIKGPHEFETPDGLAREELVITFETVPLSGAPLNQISIRYHGEDPTLASSRELSLAKVSPVIARWMSQTR